MNPVEALVNLFTATFRGAPPRPEGVRASVRGQWIEPTHLNYVGKSASGSHEWVAQFDAHVDDIDDFRIGVLPGRTSIALAFRANREDSP